MTDKKISVKKPSTKPAPAKTPVKSAPKTKSATNKPAPAKTTAQKLAKKPAKTPPALAATTAPFAPPASAKVAAIKSRLLAHFPAPKTELNFGSPYELLVAVMLSAQCTDRRVNLITPALFAAYPTPRELAAAKPAHVKTLIASCSFFNNKAENLVKMARAVCEDFGGEVPLEAGALQRLAGVGQKTANVVLIEWCGANLMAVDTHVFRVSHRLGLVRASTPQACETQLAALFETQLGSLHQALVLFGRYTCRAVKPACEGCFLREFCEVVAGANSNLDGGAVEKSMGNLAKNSAKSVANLAESLVENPAKNSAKNPAKNRANPAKNSTNPAQNPPQTPPKGVKCRS